MSGSSAPPAELYSPNHLHPAARRRVLMVLGRTLCCAALFPALRVRAQTKSAFDAGSLAEALRLLDARPTPSDDIALSVPDFVENGAVVPVEITSRLPGAQEIYILSETNPFPLVARFSVPEGTEAFVSTRIKVASSGNVHALVHFEGRFVSTMKATTVTVGGCGA
jgi:sulfur-oxidizing protein SoxY